jgi:sensor histidine kinase regulating citrate/malate metabolism
MRRQQLSLAAQLLALQLLIILAVLVAVAGVSLAQSGQEFRDVEGRRARDIAEYVAATTIVRDGLQGRFVPAVQAHVEQVRAFSADSDVIVASADRRIVAASDPDQVNEVLTLQSDSVLNGGSWTGTVDDQGVSSVRSFAPVLSSDEARIGEVVGVVAIGRRYPTVWERLGDAAPDLLTYLGVASLLGVAGSLLVSRRVKRQTLGLEPAEIRGLVEHREAMLYGIKEGVVGLDRANRVTLANEAARDLLAWPAQSERLTPADLGCDGRLADVLTGVSVGQDQVVVTDDRVITLNRRPITLRGQPTGSVTTMRDRTELVSLQKQLGFTRSATDTLRAQAHEFSNQLHTISGLIELGEYGEVVRYVNSVSQARERLADEVTSRVEDLPVAALLIAKASLAAERGVTLRISDRCRLPRVDELSADLVTVAGNLIDNALDASAATAKGWVEVQVRQDAGAVLVVVSDSGPGVAPELMEQVFTRGYSTKATPEGGQRGFGLALTRLICTRRGGDITVANRSVEDGGAVFTARLPVATAE